jgi:cytochrome b subunit of formate dehydrogenase
MGISENFNPNSSLVVCQFCFLLAGISLFGLHLLHCYKQFVIGSFCYVKQVYNYIGLLHFFKRFFYSYAFNYIDGVVPYTAVSINLKSIPSIFKTSSIVSLVVPAISLQ